MPACCCLRACWWTRGCTQAEETGRSVPRDDLALAAVHVGRIERTTAAPAQQKFRTPCADHVAPPPSRRRLARLVFRQLRQREDVAPNLPCRRDLFAVRTHTQRDGQGWV